MTTMAQPATLVDEFLPAYDVSDAVANVVNADVMTTWNALLEADLIDVGRKRPLAAVLGALRMVPDTLSHVLHGELPKAPARMRLGDLPQLPMQNGGWVLLGERANEEIALGLVGKFWRPVIAFKNVSAQDFKAFAEPGYAKTVYALSVRAIDGKHTLLSAVTRTATTDKDARQWFRRYWTFGVGSGAHVLINGLIDVVREAAEQKAGTQT